MLSFAKENEILVQLSTNYFYTTTLKMPWILNIVLILSVLSSITARRPRSSGLDDNIISNSVEHVWSMTTVAVGDTAVIHCSFDALFQQLKNENIDWVKESAILDNGYLSDAAADGYVNPDLDLNPVVIANGKVLAVNDRRFRIYRPHNSALSVLIIRRVKRQDAGYYRCNLAGSTTKHKYMLLNVTDSKIEAQTSPTEMKVKVDSDATLWCNATGYPLPIVYWTREDRNRSLPDGSHQYWGNGLQVKAVTEYDTGIYVCYLDNFVQPIVSYKFHVIVEDNPWKLDGYKMRFDSSHWFPASTVQPIPVVGKSFLLMCETRGSPNPHPAIAWYRGRELITSGKNYYIIDDSSDWRQNFVSSTLVIIRYSNLFDGRYVCIANNGFRMRKQKFHIKENGVGLLPGSSDPSANALPMSANNKEPRGGGGAKPRKTIRHRTDPGHKTFQDKRANSAAVRGTKYKKSSRNKTEKTTSTRNPDSGRNKKEPSYSQHRREYDTLTSATTKFGFRRSSSINDDTSESSRQVVVVVEEKKKIANESRRWTIENGTNMNEKNNEDTTKESIKSNNNNNNNNINNTNNNKINFKNNNNNNNNNNNINNNKIININKPNYEMRNQSSGPYLKEENSTNKNKYNYNNNNNNNNIKINNKYNNNNNNNNNNNRGYDDDDDTIIGASSGDGLT